MLVWSLTGFARHLTHRTGRLGPFWSSRLPWPSKQLPHAPNPPGHQQHNVERADSWRVACASPAVNGQRWLQVAWLQPSPPLPPAFRAASVQLPSHMPHCLVTPALHPPRNTAYRVCAAARRSYRRGCDFGRRRMWTGSHSRSDPNGRFHQVTWAHAQLSPHTSKSTSTSTSTKRVYRHQCNHRHLTLSIM